MPKGAGAKDVKVGVLQARLDEAIAANPDGWYRPKKRNGDIKCWRRRLEGSDIEVLIHPLSVNHYKVSTSDPDDRWYESFPMEDLDWAITIAKAKSLGLQRPERSQSPANNLDCG